METDDEDKPVIKPTRGRGGRGAAAAKPRGRTSASSRYIDR